MNRRDWLLVMLAAPLMARLAFARQYDLPAPVAPDLKLWGQGDYRRFGFLIYVATLWAGADPMKPPLALRLEYKRRIAGREIAEASIREMRRFTSDEAMLRVWGLQLEHVFPDVRDGDHLIGVWQPEAAVFYQDGRQIGRINDPQFARLFFSIWLDEKTSAPDLRTALLRAPVS